jgi:phosphoglycolate phosphatase-like HAD superfamily hydrolase
MAVAGAAAASTLMVGDSIVDVETARRAPARVCVARYGFGCVPDADLADAFVVDDPGDLRAILVGAVRP